MFGKKYPRNIIKTPDFNFFELFSKTKIYNLKVIGLFIYPVKSLKGIGLEVSEVGNKGLKWDRRWMLVDQNNRFLSQREFPVLAKLKTGISDKYLTIESFENQEFLKISLDDFPIEKTKVKVWDDELEALVYAKDVNQWFTERLGIEVRLVFQPEESIRPIDEKYAVTGDEETSMSDGYPILIIGEKSLEFLNSKCPENIVMERFRPNIVFEGGEAHIEDTFGAFQIGDVKLHGVKPCARCVMTTINPNTLEKTKEPLATLSTYRKSGNKILFGQNVVIHKAGVIRVGDRLLINN